MADLTELEKGLLTILAKARTHCHEPVLTQYLHDGLGWALERLRWEDQATEAGEDQEDLLRSYLRGD